MIGSAVQHIADAGLARAMRTAEVLAARLHAMADDRHLAVVAARREHVDGALKRVEDVRGPADLELECLVVGVAAALAVFHGLARGVQTSRRPGNVAPWQ